MPGFVGAVSPHLGGGKAMTFLNERYVVNEKGERVGVLLGMGDYERILEELEELESIRAYDAAKASKDEVIPLEQAIREIEQQTR